MMNHKIPPTNNNSSVPPNRPNTTGDCKTSCSPGRTGRGRKRSLQLPHRGRFGLPVLAGLFAGTAAAFAAPAVLVFLYPIVFVDQVLIIQDDLAVFFDEILIFKFDIILIEVRKLFPLSVGRSFRFGVFGHDRDVSGFKYSVSASRAASAAAVKSRSTCGVIYNFSRSKKLGQMIWFSRIQRLPYR